MEITRTRLSTDLRDAQDRVWDSLPVRQAWTSTPYRYVCDACCATRRSAHIRHIRTEGAYAVICRDCWNVAIAEDADQLILLAMRDATITPLWDTDDTDAIAAD